MTPKKERHRVTAEITVFHLTQFTLAAGTSLTADEALAFLNKDGRAYEMWKHMMRAGEEYIRATLQPSPRGIDHCEPQAQRVAAPKPEAMQETYVQ